MKKNTGISLILLIIVIIVLTTLAGTIILTLQNTNPVGSATETGFKTDMAAYRDEYNLYLSEKKLDASKSGQVYSANTDTTLTNITASQMMMTGIVNSIKEYYVGNGKNEPKIAIKNGKFTYIGSIAEEISWSKELGIEVSD